MMGLSKRVDVGELKERIERAVGEAAFEQYMDVVRAFIRFQLTKVELDIHITEILGAGNIKLHNDLVSAILSNALCPFKPSVVPPPESPQKWSDIIEMEDSSGPKEESGAAEAVGGGEGEMDVGQKAKEVDVGLIVGQIIGNRPPAQDPRGGSMLRAQGDGAWVPGDEDPALWDTSAVPRVLGVYPPPPEYRAAATTRGGSSLDGGLLGMAWRGEGELPGRASLKRRMTAIAAEEAGLRRVAPGAVEIVDLAVQAHLKAILKRCVAVAHPKRAKLLVADEGPAAGGTVGAASGGRDAGAAAGGAQPDGPVAGGAGPPAENGGTAGAAPPATPPAAPAAAGVQECGLITLETLLTAFGVGPRLSGEQEYSMERMLVRT